jgi:hypothetical protein
MPELQRRHILAAALLPLSKTLRAADLSSDLPLLRHALTALHPGLLRYQSMADFDRRFAALQAQWRGDVPAGNAYLALARFLATLRCGHSYANFYNQKASVRDSLILSAPRLPLQFRWLGPRMVVTRGQPGLPPGSEVLALNGVRAARVLAALAPCVRVDGHNEAMRASLLSVEGIDGIETFDVFHPLVFGPSPRWTVQARLPDGRERRVELEAIDAAQRQAERRVPAQASDDTPLWPVDWRADGTAVLRMPGWAVYNTRWDWRAYLGRTFERLAGEGRRGLVIDLRNNEGGLDCGDEIIARLIDAPIPYYTHMRRTRYQRVPAALNPLLDTWDDGFRDWGDAVVPDGPGWWRFPADADRRIEPRGPRFRGRVAVIVDSGNSSATLRFADMMQSRRLGVLVGDTTGGSQRGINGGAFFFTRLPNSGLEFDLPLVGTFARGWRPPTGLRPDIAVPLRPADLAGETDPVLARALVAVQP